MSDYKKALTALSGYLGNIDYQPEHQSHRQDVGEWAINHYFTIIHALKLAILNETPPIVSDKKPCLTNNPATSDAADSSGTNADLNRQDEPQDAAVRGDLI